MLSNRRKMHFALGLHIDTFKQIFGPDAPNASHGGMEVVEIHPEHVFDIAHRAVLD